jgi:hypothetical protein
MLNQPQAFRNNFSELLKIDRSNNYEQTKELLEFESLKETYKKLIIEIAENNGEKALLAAVNTKKKERQSPAFNLVEGFAAQTFKSFQNVLPTSGQSETSEKKN